MTEPVFIQPSQSLGLADIVGLTGAELRRSAAPNLRIGGVASLDRAGPHDLSFADDDRHLPDLDATGAGACLLSERHLGRVPSRVAALVSPHPFRDFVTVARALFPSALRPSSLFEAEGAAAGAMVHPTARLETGVTIDPGAVVGPRAEIGAGSTIAAGAVIGPDVRIGRLCAIGAGASLTHAFLGDRVTIRPGCRIGQDGLDAAAPGGIVPPQIGRVIIQDGVEIGAGAVIDRGADRDTVVGEGSKIDNLAQIAHNVVIGRHCVIVARAGIAAGAAIEDFVVIGAGADVGSGVTIGEGSQIAAAGRVCGDVPGGAKVGAKGR